MKSSFIQNAIKISAYCKPLIPLRCYVGSIVFHSNGNLMHFTTSFSSGFLFYPDRSLAFFFFITISCIQETSSDPPPRSPSFKQ